MSRDIEVKTPSLAYADLPKSAKKLLSMLSYKRPGGTISEDAFVKKYILPVGAQRDAWYNHWLTIPGNEDILFSCHIDTVHKTAGMQTVMYGDGRASIEAECLGADCGVGVWLMLEMIKARVPGTYVFHADEESGGQGSNAIATSTPERINTHKFAIAFDRKGTDEIITHQWEGRTASDEFADSLARVLKPLNYVKSTKGTFTDTANYAALIPECTNLSVGYFNQHTPAEYQDIGHALALREALCAADWSELVCSRQAAHPVREPSETSWWADWKARQAEKDKTAVADQINWPDREMIEYVRRNPVMVASFLADRGFTPDEIDEDWYEWDNAGH